MVNVPLKEWEMDSEMHLVPGRAGHNFKIFVCEKQERGGGQGDYLGKGNVELENVLNEE